MLKLTLPQVRQWRMSRSGLGQPFATVEDCARALGGIQAQILSASALALANRVTGLTGERFSQLYLQERRLIKIWSHRSTLHLIPAADWPDVVALRSLMNSWWQRKAEEHFALNPAAYEALVAKIEKLAHQNHLINRADLRQLGVPEGFLSWGGIFIDMAYRGWLCNVGFKEGSGQFAHRSHWLPDLVWHEPEPLSVAHKLSRQFLHTYGPATASDLAYWLGTSVGMAQQWLTELEPELQLVTWPGGQGWLLQTDVPAVLGLGDWPPDPWVLLYRFDPVLLAHRDKTWIVPQEHYKKVWRPGGHIEGVILKAGETLGTWRYRKQTRALQVIIVPFGNLSTVDRRNIDRKAQAVAEFWGLPEAQCQ